jgi:hypothetical protein
MIMSLRSIDKAAYQTDLTVEEGSKDTYGEVHTPIKLVRAMLDLLDPSVFRNPDARWMDSGAGRGCFALEVYWRLMEGLVSIPATERHDHVIRNMLFMCEVQDCHVATLRAVFGPEANIYHQSYLEHSPAAPYDYIVGNPPYNLDGALKVPALEGVSKKEDGNTAWFDFVKHSMSLLSLAGTLVYVVPLIWMRPDRFNRYGFMTSYHVDKLVCLSDSNKSKQAFGTCGQTPVCYLTLVKKPSGNNILLSDGETFHKYNLRPGAAIPVANAALMDKMLALALEYGCIDASKTNMPPKGTKLHTSQTIEYPHENIRSCIVATGRKKSWNGEYDGRLVKEFSNRAQAFSGVPKVVLAHRRLGLPYLDAEGRFGISNRDAYVITGEMEHLHNVCRLLSTKLALCVFSSARYRMKYLEKEAFWFIPNPTAFPGFNRDMTEEEIWDLFGLTEGEREAITSSCGKNYSFRVIE